MLKSFSCMVAALALLVFALFPSSARAVDVTVGGITYDVVFFEGPASFSDNAATLTNTVTAPWWGSQATATAFRDAYRDLGAPYAFDVDPGGTDVLLFAFEFNVNSTDFHNLEFLRDDTSTGTFSGQSNAAAISVNHYAYVSIIAPVPEIDGGALGQGAVILLAVWLVLRRRTVRAV